MAEHEVIVVGGGIAGICAAIQASRLGVRTALIEREIVLGGNANSNFKLHLEGANSPPSHARETGIIEEIEADALYEGAYLEPSGHMYGYFNSMFSDVLRRKCIDAGVDLYLKTVVTGVEKNGDSVSKIRAFDMLAHREIEMPVGRFVIDASGDGVAALAAGADYRMGREARSEFDESFAPESADRRMMGSALMFLLRDTGRPVPYTPPPGTPVFHTKEELPMYSISAWDPTARLAMIWVTEHGGHMDTMFDDRAIYNRLLGNVHGIFDFIKNRGGHGAENYELFWISEFIGKREGRRFVGDYILSQKDLFEPRDFPDAVAYGGRSVDLHEVTDDGNQYKVIFYGKPPLYGIPLRCLYSRNVPNLLLAGRLISGTRVALGSYRVMKTLATAGQAIGAAAYVCARKNIGIRELAAHPEELRQLLLKEDATILNAVNSDPNDLARTAKITASSEQPDSPASNVTNGINRQTAEKPTNMWISAGSLPQHVELDFGRSVGVSSMQVTFDTDLHANRGTNISQRVIPVTARDYRIQAHQDSNWVDLAVVRGNYQRMRRHAFPEVRTARIRLVVEADNGGDARARVYEVRAY
jgi:hypothetical protein